MRDCAFLEPLRGKPKHLPFLVYDIESKDDDTQRAGFTRPFLVGVYDGKNDTKTFRNTTEANGLRWDERHDASGGCIDQFMWFLLSKPFLGHRIYAHNGGGFDHLFILRWLRRHVKLFQWEIIPVASSIQQIKVWERQDDDQEVTSRTRRKRKQKCWIFLDSMKLLPMGLDRAAKSFGHTGKKGMDLHAHEDDPIWDEYLKMDCVQLYKVVDSYHDLVENKLGGEVGITSPSTSMKLFRRRFMGRGNCPKKIPRHQHFPDCSKEGCRGCAHEWVRQAYYGGRTEIFERYGEGLHYYDLNSSYVAAMREPMPAGDRRVTDELDWRLADDSIGFVECTVQIPEDCKLPPLPHRSDSGKLQFPVGTFSGVWDTEELRLLYEPMVNGKIFDVKRVVWFRKKKLFDGMVEKLWALRDKSLPTYDEGLSVTAKLLGNSLYGKFGMNEERKTIVFCEPREPGECVICGKSAGDTLCPACIGSTPANPKTETGIWYQKKEVSAAYIIPQIAAHITTLARVRLWHVMRKVLEMGKKLYYTDTDSVLTDAILPCSSELGELKDEYPGETIRCLAIQPKVYMIQKETPFKDEHAKTCDNPCKELDCKTCGKCHGCALEKVAMKGFPKQVRTRENLAKLRAGEKLKFSRLNKVRTLARSGFLDPPTMNLNVTKSFKTAYDKRVMLEDGTTLPVVLSLPEKDTPALCTYCGSKDDVLETDSRYEDVEPECAECNTE